MEVTLKDYIDTQVKGLSKEIEDLKGMVEQHFALNDRAVKLAEEALTIRLEAMNEFREQIKEERASLATRENLKVLEEKLCGRISPLEKAHAFSAGKMWMVMAGFAVIPTIIALIALFA